MSFPPPPPPPPPPSREFRSHGPVPTPYVNGTRNQPNVGAANINNTNFMTNSTTPRHIPPPPPPPPSLPRSTLINGDSHYSERQLPAFSATSNTQHQKILFSAPPSTQQSSQNTPHQSTSSNPNRIFPPPPPPPHGQVASGSMPNRASMVQNQQYQSNALPISLPTPQPPPPPLSRVPNTLPSVPPLSPIKQFNVPPVPSLSGQASLAAVAQTPIHNVGPSLQGAAFLAPPHPPQHQQMNNGGIQSGYTTTVPSISMDRGRGRYPDPIGSTSSTYGNTNGSSYPAHQLNHNPDKPKIDPAQIPRPPLFTRPEQDTGLLPVYYTRNSVDGISVNTPPQSDSRYMIVDNGNASPDLIRSSLYAVPMNRGIWHQTGDLPCGIVCTPLSIHSEDFVPRPRYIPPNANCESTVQIWKDPQAVPVIGRSMYSTSDNDGPPRCEHCLAYINPFFDAVDGSCNLCGHKNRRLRNQMSGIPMQFGTVEYDVAGKYITREDGPVQPIMLYAIDLTCPDALAYLPIIERVGCDIAEHFQRQRQFSMAGPTPAPPRIGIVLVSCLGVILRQYHRNDRNHHGSVVVVSDITEHPFCPLPLSDWTYDLSSTDGLTSWQRYCSEDMVYDVEDWRQRTARTKNALNHADGFELSCGGSALQFLSDAVSASGGRCTWISWRRPNFGVGYLRHRLGNQKLHDDDTAPYTPIQLLSTHIGNDEEGCSFYKNLATKCVKDSIALDVIIHNRAGSLHRGLELATLGELCKVTGGKLSWITCEDWQQALFEELSRQALSYSGWDAVFKVRCSDGLQVKSFYPCGGLLVETLAGASPELELSCLMPNACIAIELEHRVGGIPKGRNMVFIQTALLYTTVSGKRRVRVSTLAIQSTTILNEIYRSVDFNTAASLLSRAAIQCLHVTNNSGNNGDNPSSRNKARQLLYQNCVNILASYRQYTSANSSPMGQLLLPEKMLQLPLYCMCMLKSSMLRPSNHRTIPGTQASILAPTNDERAYYIYHLSQAMPSYATLMAHPNVFSIGPYLMGMDDDSVGVWQTPAEVDNANGFVRMPHTIPPSIELLSDDGIYLIDDGLRFYLFVGRSVPDEIKNQVLGKQYQSSEVLQRLEPLLYQMRVYASSTRGSESELRPMWAPLVRVQQQQNQSALEAEVLSLMVADGNSGEKDYVDFLCAFHRRIRERMESLSQRIKS
jgi:protein transport protein SEC24